MRDDEVALLGARRVLAAALTQYSARGDSRAESA